MALYFKLPNVSGGATAKGFAGQIEVLSFSESLVALAHTATSGSFSLAKGVDAATVPLVKALVLGQVFPSGVLSVRAATTDATIEKLTFSNLRVTALDSVSDSAAPIDSVSFAFDSVTTTYDGNTTTDPVQPPGGGTGGGAPPASLAESPLAVAVPVAGLLAAAAVTARHRARPAAEPGITGEGPASEALHAADPTMEPPQGG